ncbi:MAG TPA: hypothetical protein VKQ70_14900 [Caulobacteraceae bacterium]|nr:hypothetical protein [Caulobacteraceae bacterium]
MVAKLGPFKRQLNFAGATFPRFEDPPITSSRGADLPRDTVLRVKWDRLTFFGRDSILGPIVISLKNKPSLGRVTSLSSHDLDRSKIWIELPRLSAEHDSFFPAYNENALYFEMRVPRFSAIFENEFPVQNAAVVSHIPPEGVDYFLKAPVTFQRTAGWIPIDISIVECQMAMSTLKDIEITVKNFSKSGPNASTVRIECLNTSEFDQVEVGVIFDSTCNIQSKSLPMFLTLGRSPVEVSVELDISQATPPGFIVVAFVLMKPLVSPGSSRLTIDYDEIRLGTERNDVPIFTDAGYQRSDM